MTAKPYDDEAICEINIVPFVDIVLVLLIIFMAAVPYMPLRGLSVKLPQMTAGLSDITPSKLIIDVHHTGDIFFEGRLVSMEELSLTARKFFEGEPLTKAQIRADQSVSHGRVMEILAVLREAGLENFVFKASY